MPLYVSNRIINDKFSHLYCFQTDFMFRHGSRFTWVPRKQQRCKKEGIGRFKNVTLSAYQFFFFSFGFYKFLKSSRKLINKYTFQQFPYYDFIEAKRVFDEPFIWFHLFFNLWVVNRPIGLSSSTYISIVRTISLLSLLPSFTLVMVSYNGFIFPHSLHKYLEHRFKRLRCWVFQKFRTCFISASPPIQSCRTNASICFGEWLEEVSWNSFAKKLCLSSIHFFFSIIYNRYKTIFFDSLILSDRLLRNCFTDLDTLWVVFIGYPFS